MRLRLRIFFSELPPAWRDYEEYTNSDGNAMPAAG
jgi:hypothetical protein